MWIKQEPNTLDLWNKLHFEEEKNGEFISCLKYSVPLFVEYIYKMQRLEVSGAVRPLQWSLGVKRLKKPDIFDSFSKNHEILNFIQSVQWEPSCFMRRYGRTDGQTDMTKLTVAFRNYVDAPKNWGEMMNFTPWTNRYIIINRNSED